MGLASTGRSRTSPLPTTRKATGLTDMPAPLPPPKGADWASSRRPEVAVWNSVPPAAKPKETRETGRITLPSGVSTGSPRMVLTATISFRFSMVWRITLSMGYVASVMLPASEYVQGWSHTHKVDAPCPQYAAEPHGNSSLPVPGRDGHARGRLDGYPS